MLKNPLFLCVAASLLYASEIVAADKWLKGVSSIVLTLCVALVIAGCSATYICYDCLRNKDADDAFVAAEGNDKNPIPIRFPTKEQWAIILMLGVLNFLADWAHYAALKTNAGGPVLATFYMLIPIFCTLLSGGWPSYQKIGAWVLGGGALYLISNELTKH